MRLQSELTAIIDEAHANGRSAVASLAPSFAGFFDYDPKQVLMAVRALGFDAVEETAVGIAEAAGVAPGTSCSISSACPRVVRLVETEFPHLAPQLSSRPSALLAHCRSLRRRYGHDCMVVFFGPCRYKAWERRRNPEAADLLITFDRLARWLTGGLMEVAATRDRNWDGTVAPRNELRPGPAERIAVLQTGICGIEAVRNALAAGEAMSGVELLACPTGCLRNPAAPAGADLTERRLRVIEWATGRYQEPGVESQKLSKT